MTAIYVLCAPIIIFALVMALIWFGGLIYLASKGKVFRWLYHNKMGWHLPNEKQGFDGCSFCSNCKICGKYILQDSWGDWFECGSLGENEEEETK